MRTKQIWPDDDNPTTSHRFSGHYVAGHCGKCGAPYYAPSVWHGVLPPAPQPTCACWNLPRIRTATIAGTDDF
jgi:hypothetical protein